MILSIDIYKKLMNRNRYGDIQNRSKQSFEELCLCQAQALANPSPTTFAAEALVEEKILMQKSRIQWLSLGDQYTTFYHHVVQDRAARITFMYSTQRMERL